MRALLSCRVFMKTGFMRAAAPCLLMRLLPPLVSRPSPSTGRPPTRNRNHSQPARLERLELQVTKVTNSALPIARPMPSSARWSAPETGRWMSPPRMFTAFSRCQGMCCVSVSRVSSHSRRKGTGQVSLRSLRWLAAADFIILSALLSRHTRDFWVRLMPPCDLLTACPPRLPPAETSRLALGMG